MSRKNRGMQRIVKEAEFEPVKEEAQEQQPQGDVIDLNEVAFMVMIGRKKTGEPFFHNVNVNDVFTVDGLLNYGKRELDHAFKQHFAQKKGE